MILRESGKPTRRSRGARHTSAEKITLRPFFEFPGLKGENEEGRTRGTSIQFSHEAPIRTELALPFYQRPDLSLRPITLTNSQSS